MSSRVRETHELNPNGLRCRWALLRQSSAVFSGRPFTIGSQAAWTVTKLAS